MVLCRTQNTQVCLKDNTTHLGDVSTAEGRDDGAVDASNAQFPGPHVYLSCFDVGQTQLNLQHAYTVLRR
jgi:hypothetical protein